MSEIGISEAGIVDVAKRAAEVAAAHEEYLAGIAAEKAAEAALLMRVVEAVKPALRALCSRVQSRNGCTSGRNGCNPVEEIEYFDGAYLLLYDNEDRVKDATGNEGHYEGTRLYLASDGTLRQTEKTGTWSNWQGAWDTEEREMYPIAPEVAVAQYPVEDVVRVISKALDKQAKGVKETATKAATARAEKIAALMKLI